MEGYHNLSSVFHEMASSAHLLDSSIFKVQDTWYGRKDLRAANWAVRNLPKCIHFFRLISPLESPKIIGLQEIHSPDIPYCHGSLAFCPWYCKEEQNEGTIINHLQITHYQLGFICNRCLYFLMTGSDAMYHHIQDGMNLAGNEAEEDDEDEEHDKDGDNDSASD